MSDFATLKLGADTSGLEQAVSVHERIVSSASRAENAATKYTRASQQSSAIVRRAANEMTSYEAALAKASSALGTQVRSFDDLRRAVDPAYAAAQRYQQVQQTVDAAVRSGEASQQAANIVLQEAARKYMGVVPAAEAAAEAQERAAREAMELRQGYEAVRASVDPLFAASKRYEAAQEQVNAAVKAGIISQREAARVMDQAAGVYLSGGQNLNRTSEAAEAVAASMSPQHQAAMRNFALQLSQVGQQGAVTGNYLGALAIQIPDMAAGLGTVGILAGTAAGVLAPMALEMFRGADAAEDSERAIEGLIGALTDYNQFAELARTSTQDLRKKFGSLADQVRENAEYLSGVAIRQAMDALQGDNVALFAGLDGAREAIEAVDEAADALARNQAIGATSAQILDFKDALEIAKDEAYEAARNLGLMPDQVRQIGTEFDQLRGAQSLSDIQKEASDVLDVIRQYFPEAEKMPTALVGAVFQLEKINRTSSDGITIDEARRIAANELISQYEAQAALAISIAQFGADSVQVEDLKRQAAMETVEQIIQQEQLSGELADSVRDAAMAAYDAEAGARSAAAGIREAETAARALEQAMAAAAGFSLSLENNVRVLEAQISAMERGADASTAAMVERRRIQAEAHREAQIAAGESAEAAEAQYRADLQLISVIEAKTGELSSQRDAQRAATKATGSATKAFDKQAEAIKALEYDADPLKRYRDEVKKLDDLLAHGLSVDAYDHAIRKLNESLVESPPLVDDLSQAWGDFVASGLENFDDFADAIESGFRSLIADMIATAARNQIVLNLGLQSSGTVGGSGIGGNAVGAIGSQVVQSVAGNAVSSAIGLGGGGLGLGSSLGAGLQSTLGVGGYASSGLLSIGANAQAAVAAVQGASPLLATVGAALPAIGILAGGAALISNAFKTRKTLKDSGISGTITGDFDGFDADIDTFQRINRRRKGILGIGARNRTRTSYKDAPDLEAQFTSALDAVRGSVVEFSDALGVGASAFDGFSHDFKVSLKDLSESERLAAIQDAIAGAGTAFADMVPGVDKLVRSGETAIDTLAAMAASLETVNETTDLLGHSLLSVSVAGGGAARELLDMFGGANGFSSAVGTYTDAFLSEEERVALTIDQLTQSLADVGESMPRTRAEFRAMVEAADINTEAGRELYATLLQMAGGFDDILPSFATFTREMDELASAIALDAGSIVDQLFSASREATTAANAWKNAQDSLSRFVSDLNGSAGGAAGYLAQANAAYEAALSGDVAAVANFQTSARQYLQSIEGNTLTQFDYQVAEAQVRRQAGDLALIADGEADRNSAMVDLASQQVELLTEISDALEGGTIPGTDQQAQLFASIQSLTNAGFSGEIVNQIKALLGQTVDLTGQSASVPGFATGGYHVGGVRIVGERGPEIEATGPARYWTADQTRQMMSDRGDDLANEIRALAREVSALRSDQARGSNEIYLINKRFLDLARKWDSIGMPPERAA